MSKKSSQDFFDKLRRAGTRFRVPALLMLLPGCCLSERLLDYILQRVILCVADRLAPLVAAVLAGNLNGDMAEPAVGLRTVPVLDIRRNGDDIADAQTLRGLALLLIPALAVNTDEQLSAAALRAVER